MKLRSFCTTKEMVTRLKDIPQNGKKVFTCYTSDKGLITRIYRELKKLNSPKKSMSNEEMGQGTEQSFFKGQSPNGKKQNKTNKKAWRNTQHPWLQRKCKAMLRFHLIPVRMAIIKNTNNNKCWQECRGKGTFIHCW
jgi:hypothetical protein